MAYSVGTLTDYRNEPSELIYQELFTGSPLIDAVKSNGNIQTGIKYKEAINILTTTGTWQADSCAMNPSGTTTITQRDLTVGKIKVQLSWCEKTLENKFTQKKLAKGSTYDSLAYNKDIMADVMQNIAKTNATVLWLGDTTSGDQQLKQYDGLVKIIGAATIGGTYSGTAWSTANARTVIQGLNALVVADVNVFNGASASKLKYFCSPAVAYAYRQKLITDNLFNISGDPNQKLFAEGSGIEIVAEQGLAGTNYIYAMEEDNVVIGTDLENEEEKADLWFSKDDQLIYCSINWKYGVQVKFPSRIYRYLGV
jgi:hypothetical protein